LEAYPRKVDKQVCERAWRLRKLDKEEEPITKGLAGWKTSDQWRRDGGQFIPHPSNFLNRERWREAPGSITPERPIGQAKAGCEA
jgi:hypothetical protein